MHSSTKQKRKDKDQLIWYKSQVTRDLREMSLWIHIFILDASKVVTELMLANLSKSVNSAEDLFHLGLRLGIDGSRITIHIHDNPGNTTMAALKMLMQWNQNVVNKHQAFMDLWRTLKDLNRNEDIQKILNA